MTAGDMDIRFNGICEVYDLTNEGYAILVYRRGFLTNSLKGVRYLNTEILNYVNE